MRDSLRINNFFMFVTIVIMSIVMMVYSKYILPAMHHNSLLPCQLEVKCEDDIIDKDKIILANQMIKKGDYSLIITANIDKDRLKLIKKGYYSAIGVYNPNIKDGLVRIYIKVAKSDDTKYQGALVTRFKFKGKYIYFNKIYLKTFDSKEIKKRIECIFEGFRYALK